MTTQPPTTPSLQDKIVLITGATAGIGKVAAGALAAQKAHLVIVGRNEAKTQAVVQEIKDLTGSTQVDYLLADFADLNQVRRLAQEFKARWTRLDVLVNNAGAFFNSRQAAPGGMEMTFHVNHLAPFLLTNLLLDRLTQSAPARIINVSSEAHRSDGMEFNDLGFNRFYFGFRAYARSKLANVFFTYELNRRLGDNGVTVNALHPGHVATDIWRNNFGFIGPALKWITSRIALTPEQGADNTIYLATSPDVTGVSGQYFIKREAVPSSPLSYDETLSRRLWELSARLTGI